MPTASSMTMQLPVLSSLNENRKIPAFSWQKLFLKAGSLLRLFPQCKEGLKVHDLYAYNYTKLQQVYPTNKYDAEIVLLIIDSKLQGKGLGRKLIDFAIEKERKEKSQNVFLLTDHIMQLQVL